MVDHSSPKRATSDAATDATAPASASSTAPAGAGAGAGRLATLAAERAAGERRLRGVELARDRDRARCERLITSLIASLITSLITSLRAADCLHHQVRAPHQGA
jgi:hypothetical protein